MYNKLIRQFYTLLSAQHQQRGHHLSPYGVIVMLLAIFPMLYFSSQWLSHFVSGSLYLFPPFPQPSLLWQPLVCPSYLEVCVFICLLIFFISDCAYIFDYAAYNHGDTSTSTLLTLDISREGVEKHHSKKEVENRNVEKGKAKCKTQVAFLLIWHWLCL